jgi:hypothetical protein
MGQYFDADGLLRKYGVKKAVPQSAGEYKSYGGVRMVEQGIDLVNINRGSGLGTIQDNPGPGVIGTNYIQSDQTFFPVQAQTTSNNPRIEYVEIEVVTAATGATATLSVGLVSDVDRTTMLSATGFIANETVANLSAVGRIIYNNATAPGGIWIGSSPVVISGPFTTPFVGAGLITARAGTALFTAGYVIVRIFYTMQGTVQ